MMKMLLGWTDSRYRFDVDAKRRRILEQAQQYKRKFKYLEDAGYIVELGPDRFEITDEAKIGLLKELIKKRRRDGDMRLVMFDVPEKLKASRNYFRKHLADLGFEMHQKSVWVSDLPCEDLVRLVAKYHGLGKYVNLFIGKNVPIR